ncbi:MAG TPA: hypothetical protein VM487_14490, partial [Phycisphaerae bacterium]|nr:hypothetical protein [Phycisphaerae bacterium]
GAGRCVAQPKPQRAAKGCAYPSIEDAAASLAREVGGTLAARSDYAESFIVLRFNLSGVDKHGKPNKTFRPIHHTVAGWLAGDPPGPLPLYRVGELPPDGLVWICEGEQCVEALAGLGLPAVTSSHGAASAGKSDWTPLAKRDVTIWPDRDEPGRKYADGVAGILHGLGCRIRIITPPDGLPEGGDIVDWLEGHDAQDEETLRASVSKMMADAAPWEPMPSDLPAIVVSNRQLREKTQDAVKALEAQNNPPQIFRRGGGLARIVTDEQGRPKAQMMGDAEVRSHLSRAASFVTVRNARGGPVSTSVDPPKGVVEDVLAQSAWAFPPLDGIVQVPVVRADGSILDTPGFDEQTHLYYFAGKLDVPPIPDNPSAADLQQARALIEEIHGDFPYEDQFSRANAIAAMITPVIRQMVDGCVPLGAVDSTQAGSGKGLLVEVISTIATGEPAAIMTAPQGDDEWRKRITSYLMSGYTFINIDNIEGKLFTPSLAAALTARQWTDRQLGRNEVITVPQRATLMVTGNNIQLGGDIARRSYWIRLNPQCSRPWERDGFKHENLIQWVLGNRGRIVAAILTLVRAWDVAGRPAGDAGPRLGSFESWQSVVGGILSFCGIEGFLGNRDQLYSKVDADAAEWEAFLYAWADTIKGEPVATSVLVAHIKRPGDDNVLRDTLPTRFTDELESKSFAVKLGRALAKLRGRYFGNDGLHLETVEDRHTKMNRWVLKAASCSAGG